VYLFLLAISTTLLARSENRNQDAMLGGKNRGILLAWKEDESSWRLAVPVVLHVLQQHSLSLIAEW
jgi:hypothetical protein